MCGRAKLDGDLSEIKIAVRVPPDYPTPNFAPSWNIAPTDNLPIVRFDQKAGHRTLDLMRWGLVPYWAKDIKIGFSTINAMAETVDTKPVFREAFKQGFRWWEYDFTFYGVRAGSKENPRPGCGRAGL